LPSHFKNLATNPKATKIFKDNQTSFATSRPPLPQYKGIYQRENNGNNTTTSNPEVF